jgi:hypothetical protein
LKARIVICVDPASEHAGVVIARVLGDQVTVLQAEVRDIRKSEEELVEELVAQLADIPEPPAPTGRELPYWRRFERKRRPR